MSLLGKSIPRLLSTSLALVAGAVFWACMDIPDAPDDSKKIYSVEISIEQSGEIRTDPLKVNSNDTARLIATVIPSTKSKKLRYLWYNGEDILDSGTTYAISTSYMASSFISENFIPNHLVIFDSEGNSLETDFHVLVNAPPILSEKTFPADGDTLYGTPDSPIHFQWSFYDSNDSVDIVLEIDGISYSVGNLDNIHQSGFYPGRHSFRIIATDSFGDSDSIPLQDFYVIDTLGGK